MIFTCSLKFFSCVSKNQNLLWKLPVNPILQTKMRFLAASVQTRGDLAASAISDNSNDNRLQITNFPQQFKNYFLQYFYNNRDRYCFFNPEDIKLNLETNFESLKVLKDFTQAEKTSEDVNIPDNLQVLIENEIKSYSLEELCHCCYLINECKDSNLQINLLTYFDSEMCARILSHDERIKMLFFIRSHSRNVKMYSRMNFTYKSFSKLCVKIYKLNAQQVVLLAFCFCPVNNVFLKNFKFNLQSHVANILPELNPDELGIVTRGFLEFKFTINNAVLPSAVMQKTLNEIENFHTVPLKYVVQFLSDLCSITTESLYDFQEKLVPYAYKFQGRTLIYVLKTGLNRRYVNASLWEILANNFKKNIKHYELFDIESMVNFATQFNIQDDELLKLAIKEFEGQNYKTESDVGKLITFLLNLIHHNLYPEQLLSIILSKKFRTEYNIEKFFKIKYSYAYINSSIELDMKSHNFELLSDDEKTKIYKVFRFHVSKYYLTLCFRSLENAKLILSKIYGEKSMCEAYCLPHSSMGLVMKFDKNLQVQPIPEEYISPVSFPIINAKKPLDNDNLWLFIRFESSNNFLNDNETLALPSQTENRQLQALGYKPITICLRTWISNLQKGRLHEYVEELMNKNLQKLLTEKSQ